MHKIIQFLSVVSVVLFFTSSNVSAQFLTSLRSPMYEGTYFNIYNALDCKGDDCVAAGFTVEESTNIGTMAFWSSSDGGKTWIRKNTQYAEYRDLSQKNYFTEVQQIDPLNIIGVGLEWANPKAGFQQLGDSGLIIRTFDGGKTWGKQKPLVNGIIRNVHFSDSLTGIILAEENAFPQVTGGVVHVRTTENGGRNWSEPKFSQPSIVDCHSYGAGKFAWYDKYLGRIFSTKNNFQTIDTSSTIVDENDIVKKYYYLIRCKFSSNDTVIAYGYEREEGDFYKQRGMIVRSTDLGKTWSASYHFSTNEMIISSLSSLEHDTIYAFGSYGTPNRIIFSTDNGVSWKIDTVILNANHVLQNMAFLSINASGDFVAIGVDKYGTSTPSILIQRVYSHVSVRKDNEGASNLSFYPNPASTTLNVITNSRATSIELVDMLGRTVMTQPKNQNHLQLDISSLPRGVYSIRLLEGTTIKQTALVSIH